MTKITVTSNLSQFAAAMNSFTGAKELQKVVNAAAQLQVMDLKQYPARMGATPGTSGLYSNGNFPKAGRVYYSRGTGAFYKRKSGGITRVSVSENLKGNWQISSSPVVTVISNDVSYAGYVHGAEADSPKQSSVMKRRGWKSTDLVTTQLRQQIEARLPSDWSNAFRRHMSGVGFSITTE